MVKKSELSFNDKVFPKRVIDVPATVASQGGVHFAVPADWDFHVISHTWTDAISAMANECKAILAANGWTREGDPKGLVYIETFKEAGLFDGKEYYNDFIEFLVYLQGDGVERVWFDALCINQLDNVEKASEMVNMGAYYGLTKACYVATHGIGSPNGFRVLASDTDIPRWFTRVWTLQESILPSKIYFLVEKFEENIIKFVVDEASSHFEDKAWIDWDENVENGEDIGIREERHLYSKGAGDLSRRKVGSSDNLYFLGAKAYFEMMATLLGVHVHGLQDLSPKLFDDFYEAFGELASGDQDVFIQTVVKQIRVRNCSVEEDRVLGILGLIGFKGEHSLESSQGLDAQIIALAKLLFVDKGDIAHLLINLCAAEYEGYEVENISWAPDMRADPDDSKAQFRRYFIDYVIVKQYEAKVTNVKEDGSLVMQAQIVKGILIRKEGISYELKVGNMVINLSHDTDLDDNLPIHTNYGEHAHASWLGGMMVAAPNIQKLKSYSSHDKPLPITDIILVYLGNDRDVHQRGSTCVLMACIPIGDHVLHKIGNVHPHPSLAARARRLFISKSTQVVVGGVGGNLTPYLHEECQRALKSLAT
eukprot:c23764_g1_i1 orf=117-1895(-)